MTGYYTLFKSGKSGEWYFNLKAGNHEIILQSEGYVNKSSAEAGISSVQQNGGDDARFERKQSDSGNFWFVLTAANGQTIGKSEMYPTAAARDKGVESVKTNAATSIVRES